jgi:hypothetical protein
MKLIQPGRRYEEALERFCSHRVYSMNGQYGASSAKITNNIQVIVGKS